ncbi:tRNA dihydrouridine synthase DusB [Sporichthya polymorpha]|uniref:tRNA dihydrouridine synthase DusB n=1 Tax=Sporichthya polymorpha TaxID=35751 RepID=UPI000362738C|nr:tRNA dihydrouridine synthase DusB [Sporichthya polymorpha]
MLTPLRLGTHEIWPPVVLAPMAGITNRAFRRLCREHGAGLYVNEMVTARGLVEGDRTTRAMVSFDADEFPRSLQLYGTDADSIAGAVRLVVAENLADHVDLNFGCPVPKVTRKGGGSALPWKRALFARIVAGAVDAADGAVPVTVKMRVGIDDEHPTFLDAGRIAAEAGVAWVALHARTAAQHYSGQADWSKIAELKESLAGTGVPVLGNGDIWEAGDALRMVAETGCDGVVVGRGCLGRPWLFGNLAAAFDGRPDPGHPGLGQVAATLRRHADLMTEDLGEFKACQEIRKHIAWYLKGFAVGSGLRQALGLVGSLAELDRLLAELDTDQEFPAASLGVPRGRAGSPRRVALPDGWLDDAGDAVVDDADAGLAALSGG